METGERQKRPHTAELAQNRPSDSMMGGGMAPAWSPGIYRGSPFQQPCSPVRRCSLNITPSSGVASGFSGPAGVKGQ